MINDTMGWVFTSSRAETQRFLVPPWKEKYRVIIDRIFHHLLLHIFSVVYNMIAYQSHYARFTPLQSSIYHLPRAPCMQPSVMIMKYLCGKTSVPLLFKTLGNLLLQIEREWSNHGQFCGQRHSPVEVFCIISALDMWHHSVLRQSA